MPLRVLETDSPSAFYLPPGDVDFTLLQPDEGHTFCECKGLTDYFCVELDDRVISHIAWPYPEPFDDFGEIKDYVSFYPEKCVCFVAGERVKSLGGGYYGGWVTSEIVGPFKGQIGTSSW